MPTQNDPSGAEAGPRHARAPRRRKIWRRRNIAVACLVVAVAVIATVLVIVKNDSGVGDAGVAVTDPNLSSSRPAPSAADSTKADLAPVDTATASSAAASSAPASSAPASSAFAPPANLMPAITVSGNKILRNGQTWWLLGYNSFTWSGNCGRPNELMTSQQVDDWFASMRHDGHGAVRLMFYPGWSIPRLDDALIAAQENNIYVTLTIGSGTDDCGQDEKDASWFADTDKRAAYAAHMTTLLERYRGDTTIAWFEYFNEPGYADGALRGFYDEMGALAKSVDPQRLFASGTIAPYAMGGDANFRNIAESPGVDISSLHEYDYDDAESGHGADTRADSDGKPVIVGEFGVAKFLVDEQQCQADIAKRAARVQRKVSAYSSIPGYIGAFAWAWQPGTTVGTCGGPGIDTDEAVKNILRTAVLP